MDEKLKLAFLPFAAPGHMIPLMDIAMLFSDHGADVTFITTTANALLFQNSKQVKIHTLQFPYSKFHLPPGIETFGQSTDISAKLGAAFQSLNQEIEQILREMKVDCIVSDMILSWTTDAASRLGIPRLVFQVSGFISNCIEHSLRYYKPHEQIDSESEPFLVPGLPHEIEMTRSELPQWLLTKDETIIQFIEKAKKDERNSYGVLINSFHELEADYVEYYHKQANIGLKTWAIGPVSLLVNSRMGMEMEWLNSKEALSVIYINFGSMTKFPSTQLLEIAHGVEDSGHDFIWVVRKKEEDEDEELPEGFEERMKERKKGLIIRKWAKQVSILNHPSVGGFVTHCGWNSVIESVSAGKPIITWPLTAEQFYNEKLVTRVLKIGVSVGARKWWDLMDSEALEIVKRDQITKAVAFLMGDDKEVVGMRDRAKELGFAAKRAVNDGGSSHNDLVSLINELKIMKKLKRQNVV